MNALHSQQYNVTVINTIKFDSSSVEAKETVTWSIVDPDTQTID